MKRLLTICLLMFSFLVCTAPAHADGLTTDSVHAAGFNNLTEQQKAAIITQIAEQAAPVANVPTAAKVGEWVDIGQKIGQGLGSAAKEVGVAVNQFVETPVGKWTMALIVWKFMGNVVVHLIGGIMIMLVGTTMVIYFARRYNSATVIYDPERKNIFGNSIKKLVERKGMGGDVGGFLFAEAVVLVASMVATFTY